MKLHASPTLANASLIALAGYILSGPGGLLLVRAVAPQPEWQSAAAFVRNYHVVQDVPYYFGLLLIGGMLLLAVGHYQQARQEPENVRFNVLTALVLTTAFAALIFFNYICQTTFVRTLALNYRPENDALIAAFSMANPRSLAWAVEMWGYGILGVATWFLASYYRERSQPIRLMLIANGVLSVLCVVYTVMDIGWVLTPFGVGGYLVWNVLMIALMIALYRHYRVRNVAGTLAL